jgi:pimeloyl-ACP methyl ester carboxylesterase
VPLLDRNGVKIYYEDHGHGPPAADYMARKIPGATRVTIPDAGHASNLHQPVAFNRAVQDFLGGLPAAA